ncbi:hypothetical protein UFOVP1049_51 [uncultured Caudovirales phage]|uniref:Uncharacterized protein n=1 Tax=uncultured Caudovirales phage TaxID=2100421 RepID=A0A6J5QHV4_9CAUD|nr:hypothetical protein UFOVP1049_51 [uncultured Caudovirales phage]
MKDEIAGTIYAKDYTDWMVKTGGFARDMTLRDWYMGTVVQGLLTAEIVGDYSNEHVAEIASVITDAILKERAK